MPRKIAEVIHRHLLQNFGKVRPIPENKMSWLVVKIKNQAMKNAILNCAYRNFEKIIKT